MNIDSTIFGQTPNEDKVSVFTLENDNNICVKITNYGGIITELHVPDRNGNIDDIVLGFDNLNDYLNNNDPYMGALIGRYANRIAKGHLKINDVEYQLAVNNGSNHLHGGNIGFDKRIWRAVELKNKEFVGLKLSLLSIDGDENYPGNLKVNVTYKLNNKNELAIEYKAESNKDTVVNLTNHSYFNLAGAGNGLILNHNLKILADKYTEVTDEAVPTGEIKSVKNTVMDFTDVHKIGERIQGVQGRGYDHNYVLNKKDDELALAAEVYEETSGRCMKVFTTKPGMQFYTGNYVENVNGKNEKVYQPHSGFCLETQYFPDSPNQPEFPSALLKAGEKYNHTTVFQF